MGWLWAEYWLAMGWLLAGHGLAIRWVWYGYGLAMGWLWAGYGLSIGGIWAGYRLAMVQNHLSGHSTKSIHFIVLYYYVPMWHMADMNTFD